MNPALYAAILSAERAVRHAHDLSYEEPRASYGTRYSLGRAQSILMRYVVKHASEFRVQADRVTPGGLTVTVVTPSSADGTADAG